MTRKMKETRYPEDFGRFTKRSAMSSLMVGVLCATFSGCGSGLPPELETGNSSPSKQSVPTDSPVAPTSETSPRNETPAVATAAPSTSDDGLQAVKTPLLMPVETGSEKALPAQPLHFNQDIVQAFEKLMAPADSFEDWEKAHQALLNFGKDAVPLLAHKLQRGEALERETAASSLVAFGPDAEPAIAALRNALQDDVPFVRANAAVTLVQFPEESKLAIPVLVSFLEHTDPNLQQMAAMNLSALGTDASLHVKELTRILGRTDGPEILLPVVELLGRIGPAAEVAVPKLKQIAFEQTGEIQNAARSAIQLIEASNAE